MSNNEKLDTGNKDDDKIFKIYKKENVSTTAEYNIYLSDEVEHGSDKYIEILKLLDDAEENDKVTIHLANFGGSVHTGFRVAHSIKNCSAPVTMLISAPCYSMGAILAVCGASISIMPGAFLMFHNYHTHTGGKGGELKMQLDEFNKHFEHALKYFCSPFLSTKEIKQLIKDEDLYIHSTDKDFKTRLKRHYK